MSHPITKIKLCAAPGSYREIEEKAHLEKLTDREHALARFLRVSHDDIAVHDDEHSIFTGKDSTHIHGLYFVIEAPVDLPEGYCLPHGKFQPGYIIIKVEEV